MWLGPVSEIGCTLQAFRDSTHPGCGLLWTTTTWQSSPSTISLHHFLIRRMVEIEQSNLSAIYWAVRPISQLHKFHALFRVSSWNNGVRCMSVYILILLSYWSWGMDKWLHPRWNNAYDYLSIVDSHLSHVRIGIPEYKGKQLRKKEECATIYVIWKSGARSEHITTYEWLLICLRRFILYNTRALRHPSYIQTYEQ